MRDDADVVVVPPGRAITASGLLLSPHSDDVAFSLGAALLEGRFARGRVVTVFSVSACIAADTGESRDRVTALRRAEDCAFATMIGSVLEWHDLGRLDAPIRLGLSENAVCQCSDVWHDEAEIVALVQALEHTLAKHSICVVPLGLGGHVDHHTLLTAVVRGLPRPLPIAFYEDLPYAGGMRLSSIGAHAQTVSREIGEELRLCVLQSGVTPCEKLRSVGIYRSQMDEHTADRIERHGRRAGDGRVAERLWCSPLALSRLFESEVPACSRTRQR